MSLQNWLYLTKTLQTQTKGLEADYKSKEVQSVPCSTGKICADRVPDIIFDQFCHKSVMPSLRWQAKVKSLSPTDSQTSKEFLPLPTNYNFSPILTWATMWSLLLFGPELKIICYDFITYGPPMSRDINCLILRVPTFVINVSSLSVTKNKHHR